MKRQPRPKPIFCFKQIRYPQEKKVWKCKCGALTDNLICPNCQSKKKKSAKQKQYEERLRERIKSGKRSRRVELQEINDFLAQLKTTGESNVDKTERNDQPR